MNRTAVIADETRLISEAHRRQARIRILLIVIMVFLVLAALLLDLSTGPSSLSFGQLWQALLGNPETSRAAQIVFWQVRFPAALLAVLVGAALSLAGAEMQTILDNPLASPFTLGVSSAAAFGASLAIVLGIGVSILPPQFIVVGNAFLCAFGSVMVLHLLVRGNGSDAATLVLFGIALVFTFNALTALVQLVASADSLQQLVFWGMGSLADADWPPVGVLALVLAVTFPFSLASAWYMTALRFGDERARSYGIDVARLRFFTLLRVSLLAASAVAFVGTVGFVGLVGPHIARLLVGEDHRFLLPASLLTGALVMSLAATLSKVIIPGLLLPVGIVTSLVGLPVFIVLVHRNRNLRR
jgi:iron complex transport system permease protein